ncbi:MAG: hypothetical protein PHR42_05020 [Caldisericia bacterium]|jgi:hypothetical protein|nr:hypothetical protein [Caldisericia bacterium]
MKWLRREMSYLLGIIKDNIWDIIKTEKDSHQEVVKKFKNFIKKCIVDDINDLDEETYDLIKQAIKEYNKTGDLKKDFINRYGINEWNRLNIKY